MKNVIEKYFKEQTILCFSIIVTNKCNASCTYCHFYDMHKNKDLQKDISDKTYKIYIKFIKRIKQLLPKNVELQFRFSGGEPLMLGERLFQLADYGYKQTGIKPYILTNGSLICNNWIKQAQKHSLKYLFVSIENPFNADIGAPEPKKIIEKIKKFNNKKLPIIPGGTIIKNENFKILYKTCKYFYDKLGVIPGISELNYQAFQKPSEQEYKDLYYNVLKIVKEFYTKTQLSLFPYISPELSYGGKKQILLELNIDNSKYHFNENNIDKKINLVLKQIKKNYPKNRCKKIKCEWFEFCQNYKWFWNKTFNKMTLKEKQKSYCTLKKTINQAFYDAIKSIKI